MRKQTVQADHIDATAPRVHMTLPTTPRGGAEAPRHAAPAATAQPVLDVRHVEKVYGARNNVTRALADVSFTVARGEFVGRLGRPFFRYSNGCCSGFTPDSLLSSGKTFPFASYSVRLFTRHGDDSPYRFYDYIITRGKYLPVFSLSLSTEKTFFRRFCFL